MNVKKMSLMMFGFVMLWGCTSLYQQHKTLLTQFLDAVVAEDVAAIKAISDKKFADFASKDDHAVLKKIFSVYKAKLAAGYQLSPKPMKGKVNSRWLLKFQDNSVAEFTIAVKDQRIAGIWYKNL